MRAHFFTVAAIATSLLFSSTPAEAAKRDKAGKREGRMAARMMARFDRDNSGSLDKEEGERVRHLFAQLKKLDADNNGELSESEVSAAKVSKGKKRFGKRKKNKAA